ncbi:MAG TPA: hypothetical protein VJX67_17750 [Blastocatellia bacterium]|nr:hypothetical protein [Blastocatellia bacterium]
MIRFTVDGHRMGKQILLNEPHQVELKVFSSLQEADESDASCYAARSPEERVDVLLEIVARYRESIGETAEIF